MIPWFRSLFSSDPVRQGMRRILEVELRETRLVPYGVLAVGAGPGSPSVVALFHNTNNSGVPEGVPYASFAAMDPAFRGGVRVAVGHFTSTTTLQVAVVAGPG